MAPLESTKNAAGRGMKRKRPSGKTPAGPGGAVKKVRVGEEESKGEVIEKKLHHGRQEVRKAAKKAVAFELRKLVKRLKQARTQSANGAPVKGDDPAEMERQLEVCKSVDHERIAATALRTKVLKDKALGANGDVRAAVEAKLAAAGVVAPEPPGSAAAKVHGRLLSSKVLAEAVRAVVETLREVLDPGLARARGRTQAQAGMGGSEGESESGEDDEEEEGESEGGEPVRRGKRERVEESEDEDEEDEAVDDAGWESGTVDGGDDGADWESGPIDDEAAPGLAGPSSDEESSEDESDDDLRVRQEPKQKPSGKTSKTSTRAPSARPGESTFLPSLSVGFTRGDSDASDLSDADEEARAADAPKKNRRGQRARRAIWEKKYGRNANHVKNQRDVHAHPHGHGHGPAGARQQRPGPDGAGGAGGGPKFRAGNTRESSRPGPVGRGAHGQGRPPVPDAGWPSAAARASARDPARSGAGAGAKGGGGGLHPSWEAKRRLKEKLNPGIVPAQGKKITF